MSHQAFARRRGWMRANKLLVVVLLSPLLGLVGVVVGELVSDRVIASRMVASIEAGTLGDVERPTSTLGTTTDRSTECVTLAIGLADPPGMNVVKRAIRSSTYYSCGPTVQQLAAFAETGDLVTGGSYMRYWHGYALVTRPVMAAVGVEGLRWLSFGVLAASMVGAAVSVEKRFGWTAAVALVAPALLTTDAIVAGLTVSQALGMSTAWFGGWIALLYVERRPSLAALATVCAAGGVLNAYADLMTTPMGAMAVTVCLALLGYVAGRRDAGAWSPWAAPIAVASWFVAFGGMWVSKWVLGGLAMGFGFARAHVVEQIRFRVSGEYVDVTGGRWNGLLDNVRQWWSEPLTPLVVLCVVVVVAAAVYRMWSGPDGRAALRSTALAATAVLAPLCAWYMVLNNHSQIHFWLVYRSLPFALGAVAALAVSMRDSSPRPRRGGRLEA